MMRSLVRIFGNICKTIAILTLSSALPAIAELNQDNYTSQNLLTKEGEEAIKPFSVELSTEVMGKADFDNKRCRLPLNDLQFSMSELDLSAGFYYDACNKEGLLATASYTYTRIIWQNPYFDQSYFNTVGLAIAGFTERADDWVWKGLIRLNADVDHFDASENFYWDILLGGRYAYTEDFGLSMGFIALTGMKIDRLYPILGFDWKINERWKLNLVYPINISLIYTWDEQWSFELATRSFDERHRVGKGKSSMWNQGLIEYRATGGEFGINFKSCDGNWVANLHAGEIVGGRLKVATKGYNDKKRYNFKNAPYVGGEIAGRF